MKKFKSGLLAVALLAGISGAFVSQIHATTKQTTLYNWTSTSTAPKNPSSTLDNASVSSAESHFGCSTGSIDCADGTKVSGPGPSTAQILHN